MINVLSRDLNEKTKFIREYGYIPAVIYGTQLEKSIPIKIYKTDIKRMIYTDYHKGIIDLNLDGDIKKCLLKEVQIDGIKGYFLHIDFMLIK